MFTTFRTKLFAIVGSAAFAFVVLFVTNMTVARRTDAELAKIEQRHLPRVELTPRLDADLDRLSRAFQDAVAANDLEAVDAAHGHESAFLQHLSQAGGAVEPAEAEALRRAMHDYYDSASSVSRRLIAHETGEGLVDAMTGMQRAQGALRDLVKHTEADDRHELATAFAAASAAQANARRIELLVSALAVGFVVVLSMWLSRGALRSVAELTYGLERFGRGELTTPIAIVSRDELGTVAAHANTMAEGLRKLNAERDRSDWTTSAHAGLNDELRGELTVSEVAARAVRFIARYLDVPCGAFYVLEDDVLRTRGHYATSGEAPVFRLGEGLVGEAAQADGIVVVAAPPSGYLRVQSGLGEGSPKAIVLASIARHGKVVGVLELATFEEWAPESGELLLSLRETIAISLEVAQARTATRELLERTEQQAAQLKIREEDVRRANEELLASNEELTAQTKALEERNAELASARAGLERKAEELATVSAYKSQFLANMSHELRTPLNSMLLLSNLLAENDHKTLTDKQVEYAQTIHGAGSDLLALINQVLDLAKVEAGKQDVRIADVSLALLADQCERVFEPLARKKGLRLVVEVAAGLPLTIATDAQRTVQILNNLLGNAIKFTERGAVTLTIGRADPETAFTRKELSHENVIAFSVSDTGAGIARADLERIFAPFEQADGTSDRRHGGTGLGLTIGRELSALLGGELQLESVHGEGSTFTLYLPRRRIANSRVVPDTGPEPSLSHLGDDYLLVIEDDKTFAGTLAGIIREHGFDCFEAGDGATGLRVARARLPRGIILDVKLPDIDGWTVMNELRSDPKLATVPVHFLSATHDAGRGLAMGAVGYATKPATRRELVRVVDALTLGHRSAQQGVLVVEPDESVGQRLIEQLEEEGITARRVKTGDAALAAVEGGRYGCALLSLELPDMDGFELVERLAARGGAEPVSLVVRARALDREALERLEACSARVVLDGETSSEQRLLDEIRSFVRRLKEGVSEPKPSELVEVKLSGRKVLLADDDMRTVYALSAILRTKGVDVVVADTGVAALEAIGAHPAVDAVLMDIMMPEMDGYEAMRRIRRDVRFATLPIIALTAKAMRGDRDRCIEAGATEYLPKPIDAERLLRMLQSLLDRRTVDASRAEA